MLILNVFVLVRNVVTWYELANRTLACPCCDDDVSVNNMESSSSEDDLAIAGENVENVCYFHLQSVPNGNACEMTEARWKKASICASSWLNLDGRSREIAVELRTKGFLDVDKTFDEILHEHPDFGFHACCYRRFIDISLISRVGWQSLEVCCFMYVY
jgi:hypothetical protein